MSSPSLFTRVLCDTYSTRQKKLSLSVSFNGLYISVLLPYSRTAISVQHPFNFRMRFEPCLNGHLAIRLFVFDPFFSLVVGDTHGLQRLHQATNYTHAPSLCKQMYTYERVLARLPCTYNCEVTKVVTGRRGLSDFLYVQIQTGSMGRRSGSGGPSKRTDELRNDRKHDARLQHACHERKFKNTSREKNRLIHMLKGLLQNL